MRKSLLIVAGIAVAAFVAVLFLVLPQWPFEAGNFKKHLEEATGSTAQIGSFHQVFFPHPGGIAEHVTLTPTDPGRPTIHIQRLVITGWYWGLIGKEKHLHKLKVDGLQVRFPAAVKAKGLDTGPSKGVHPVFEDISFDEIDADNSQLVFGINGDAQSHTFSIYKLSLKHFSPKQPLRFSSVLHIPDPPGEVQIEGQFGPLLSEIGKTALSGNFTLKDADLSKYQGIAGKVSGKGSFSGNLEALHVQGTTDTPNFTLTSTGHALPLHTQYDAMVNGTNGDVTFQPVHAQLGDTKLVAQGQLASPKGEAKKVLLLDISSDDARIQDLLYLFVQSKAPLQGATRFQAKVQLPFTDSPFVERVAMTAHFGIRGSQFTSADTRQKVSELSESARGNPSDEDPPTVLTDLTGDVALADANARFSRLSFHAPGVSAILHGKYNLEREQVDLHGTMQTDVNLSKATTGFKAFLMKVVEVAKKKKNDGATVPVSITGTYSKPSFSIDAPAEK